jgi:hypothetical protein
MTKRKLLRKLNEMWVEKESKRANEKRDVIYETLPLPSCANKFLKHFHDQT